MANVTTTFLNNLKSDALTYSATQMTHVAFGSGTADPLASDTTLEGEFERLARQDLTTTSSKVTVSGFLGAGTGNGNTIAKVGAFNSGSGGDMAEQFKLASAISKTSDKEVWVDVEATITVTED
jgi:hypothetical protein